MTSSSLKFKRLLWFGLLVTLAVGFWLKLPCADHSWGGFEYQRWCYSDIIALYETRQFSSHAFPYLTSQLEYPVGIGLIAGAVGKASATAVSFLVVNSLILAMMAAVTLWCLQKLLPAQPRFFIFALAPTLALYAFLNWDLLAVGLLTLGLVAYTKNRDGWAGIWLGVGAATKLFPGLLVPGLLLTRYLTTRRLSWQLVGGAVAGFLVLNLPIYLANPAGWWYPWEFQATRFPNFETTWFFLYHHFGVPDTGSFWWTVYPRLTGWLALGIFFVGLASLLLLEWRNRRSRPVVISFLTLVLFLLTTKVFSPQYLLWVLPFLVLLPFPRWAVASFFVIDFLTWAAIANYLPLANSVAGAGELAVLEVMVGLRYLILIILGCFAFQQKKSTLRHGGTTAMMRT